jgi:hypothetical protein
MELPDKEEQQMAAPLDDAFTKLERGESDKKKGQDLNARVAELYYDSSMKYKNDYQLNKMLRRDNRSAPMPPAHPSWKEGLAWDTYCDGVCVKGGEGGAFKAWTFVRRGTMLPGW